MLCARSEDLLSGGSSHTKQIWLVTPLPHAQDSAQPPNTSAATAAAQAKDAHSPRVEYLATLSRHAAVVNVVRFSPSGNTLASAGDDGTLILWTLSDDVPKAGFGDDANEAQFASEVWKIRKSLRSTGAEIYDLAWSPDSQWLVVGSTDNTARIIRASTGDTVAQITDHNNYVQGVAWDPLCEYLATQSSDRHMHMYQIHVRGQGENADLTYKLVGKNNKMDVQHEKPESTSSNRKVASNHHDDDVEFVGSSSSSSSRDTFKRPEPKRAASSSRNSNVGVERHDLTKSSEIPAQDSASVSSRRSSVSSVHDSPSSHSARTARSPSPMPPLPAIKVPVATSPSLMATSLSPRVPQMDLNDAKGTATPKHHASSKSNNDHGQPDAEQEQVIKSQQLYGGQEASPFFRRLAWSTDGSLLLTPAGQFDDPFLIDEKAKEKEKDKEAAGTPATASGSTKKRPDSTTPSSAPNAAITTLAEKKGSKPTVFIYGRGSITRPPIAHLPGHKTHSIAIRFNPLLWELRRPHKSNGAAQQKAAPSIDLSLGQSTSVALSDVEDPQAEPLRGSFDLPHRMIYAIATHESVYVYDTQQAGPFCMFGNLHYAPFTDLSWTADGRSLVLASQDGYCSIVAFEPHELGTPLPEERQMKHRQQASPAVAPIPPEKSSISPALAQSSPAPASIPQVRPREEAASSPSKTATPAADNAPEQQQQQPQKKKARRVMLTSHGASESVDQKPL